VSFPLKISSVQRISTTLVYGVLLLAMPAHGLSDPFVVFAKARNAFEGGDYAESASRFAEFLADDPDVPALIIEAHKYLAISYLFLGNRKQAEDQFIQLLTRDTEYSLDPLIFPIDVVDFFTEIRRAHATQLERIASARRKAEAEQKKEEERQRQLLLEKLRTHVYLEKQVTLRSPIVAWMPFGAGQFQNGHRRKGWALLSGQAILLTSGIVTYALHQQLNRETEIPFTRSSDRQQFEQQERVVRIVNHTSLISLALLMVAGMIDAMVHFTPQEISFRVLEETDVPRQYRKRSPTPVSFHPNFGNPGKRSVQLDMTLRF
jgi:hypothetical protein